MDSKDFLRFTSPFPEPYLLLSGKGDIAAANPAAAARLRISDGSAPGVALGDILAEPAERVAAFLEECRTSRSLITDALSIRGPSDESIQYRCEAARVDGSGVGARILLRLRDPSTEDADLDLLRRKVEELAKEAEEGRRAQEALRQSEERFRLMVEGSEQVFFFETDDDRRFTYLSPSVTEVLGFPPEKLIGKSYEDLLAGDPGHSVREPERRDGKRERDGVYYLVVEHDDGRERVLEIVEQPTLRDDDVVGLQGFARDVTERWRAEDALRKSEEMFSKAFRTAPLGVTLSSLESGKLLEANEKFLKLVGYRRKEVLGRDTLDLGLYVNPSDRAEAERIIREHGRINGLQVRLRAKSGDVREIQLFSELVSVDGEDCALSLWEDVTERNAIERELKRQALRDALTGLPNRYLFEDRLDHAFDRAQRGKTRLAVMYLDLDQFKAINDTLGHSAGDELLVQVSERLETCFRANDTVTRLGGDEFVCLVEDLEEDSSIKPVIERMIRVFDDPFDVLGRKLDVTASIGVAVSSLDLKKPEDLLRFADVAMYKAKAESGTYCHIFDPVLDHSATERLHQINELRRALKRGEFSLRYQPIIDLRTGALVGVEALVRWEHPDRGEVLPGAFISLAEEAGLLSPIGDWVLASACRQVAKWKRMKGVDFERLMLSINLSTRQLGDQGLPDRILALLDETGLDPSDLLLEITESVAMSKEDRLHRLKESGVRIAIDDFGSGYSSLRYLKGVPADVIKVDRYFVHSLGADPWESAIVETVLALAQRLALGTIVEGIETAEQLEYVRRLGGELGQGFYFSKPLTVPDFEAFLRKHREAPERLVTA